MADSTTRGLDLLCDLTRTKREAVQAFAHMSRRWKPVSRGFILYIGGVCRAAKERRAFEENALASWCDDGGRC